MKIREIMTTDVFSLGRNDRLYFAKDIMKWDRVRHIPIVDDEERLVGLVTHRDLLRASTTSLASYATESLPDPLDYFYVHEIMLEEVISISPDADIREAAITMLERKIGCLPVVEENKLVGLVTEADFLRFIAKI